MTTARMQERLEEVALDAQLRLQGLDAALAALVTRLGRIAHATDWQSPAAQAFHEDATRLHAAVVGLRARGGEIAADVMAVRAGAGAM